MDNILDKLRKFYSKMPKTSGCMENLEKCKAFCCRINNPQVLNCEFCYVWDYIVKNWDYSQVAVLIEKCFRNYLSNEFNKACVFLEEGSNLCGIHESRVFNCYIYGITPEEEIRPRVEKFKKMYKDDLSVIIRDQCDKVLIDDGSKLKKEDTDKWWEELNKIEVMSGIKEEDIHDMHGGSYRTFHDHILLRFIPEDMMEQLSALKIHGSKEEKELFIVNYMTIFVEKLKANQNGESGKPQKEDIDTGV